MEFFRIRAGKLLISYLNRLEISCSTDKNKVDG
jgi:hypothetical protein